MGFGRDVRSAIFRRVETLLLVQAIANLYLPELNAEIINNGVLKGDIDYIIQTGGVMLVVTFALGIAAIIGVYFGARVAMGFGRDVRSGDLPAGRDRSPRPRSTASGPPRSSPATPTTSSRSSRSSSWP